jgi:hypothetical protein
MPDAKSLLGLETTIRNLINMPAKRGLRLTGRIYDFYVLSVCTYGC